MFVDVNVVIFIAMAAELTMVQLVLVVVAPI